MKTNWVLVRFLIRRVTAAFIVLSMSTGILQAGAAEGFDALEARDYAAAIREFAPLADAQNVEGLGVMSYLNWYGYGVPKNQTRALAMARAAEKGNDSRGIYILAVATYSGTLTRRDVPAAKQLLQRAATLGNEDAALQLADILFAGTAADRLEAYKVLKETADNKAPKAALALATRLVTGKGITKNTALGMDYFEIAAKVPEGQVEYGRYLMGGTLNPGSLSKAKELLEKAAEKNLPQALSALGHIHDSGLGVPVDRNRAAGYFARCAALGSSLCQRRYANIVTGVSGVKRNASEARKNYKLAAQQGDLEAAISLAVDIHDAAEQEGKKSCGEIFVWGNPLASKNHRDALALMGDYYASGRCENADFAVAYRNYSSCSAVPYCQFKQGVLTYNGFGTAQSKPAGEKLIRGALAAGYSVAQVWLDAPTPPQRAEIEKKNLFKPVRKAPRNEPY